MRGWLALDAVEMLPADSESVGDVRSSLGPALTRRGFAASCAGYLTLSADEPVVVWCSMLEAESLVTMDGFMVLQAKRTCPAGFLQIPCQDLHPLLCLLFLPLLLRLLQVHHLLLHSPHLLDSMKVALQLFWSIPNWYTGHPWRQLRCKATMVQPNGHWWKWICGHPQRSPLLRWQKL